MINKVHICTHAIFPMFGYVLLPSFTEVTDSQTGRQHSSSFNAWHGHICCSPKWEQVSKHQAVGGRSGDLLWMEWFGSTVVPVWLTHLHVYEHLWKRWSSQHEHDCQCANNGTSFNSNEPVAVCPSIRWQDLKAKADCITSWGFQDTSCTAQGGGGSFKNRKPIADGRANPLMDRKVVQVSSLTSCWCVLSKSRRVMWPTNSHCVTNYAATIWQTN